MNRLSNILSSAMLWLAVFSFAILTTSTGCFTVSSEAELADGSKIKTKGRSTGSKSAVEHLQSAWTLNQTNATRNVQAQGVTTEGQFAEIGGLVGQAVAAGIFAASQNPAVFSALARPQVAPAPPLQTQPRILGAVSSPNGGAPLVIPLTEGQLAVLRASENVGNQPVRPTPDAATETE